jgi:transposase
LRRGRLKKSDDEAPEDQALGRSRGGFTTKLHILCDGQGHPLHFHLTAGQTHESTVLDTLLEDADKVLRDGDGKRVAWPVALAGDKGYRADWIDEYLLQLGIQPVIPTAKNQDRDQRPVKFNKRLYRCRHIIENLIGWLKESRRIFTRYEKTARNFAGMIKWAFLLQYLRYDVKIAF